ncbi:MAG: MarR family winged helix-turn-helix transcriptional regulator [Bifidobacteriaceae bacterium]|nr:MarR family winged helix-turn-helix transcriptional regulator [Bifidobacteriaceae bacterium]
MAEDSENVAAKVGAAMDGPVAEGTPSDAMTDAADSDGKDSESEDSDGADGDGTEVDGTEGAGAEDVGVDLDEPDRVDVLGSHLHFALLRAYHYNRRLLVSRLESLGLLPAECRILEFLQLRNGVTATDICEGCVFDKSTVSNLLRRLESRGLVHRTRLPHDHRAVAVELTELGHELAARVCEICDQVDADASAGMDSDQSTLLVDAINLVAANSAEKA